MSKRIIALIVILTLFIVTIFLYRSDHFDIQSIEITTDNGDIPKTIEDQINNLKGSNLLFIDKKAINNNILNNDLIESIQIKREFPKKLRIYLKKTQVNAIITYYDGSGIYYSIIDKNLMPLDSKDIASIASLLPIIESDKESVSFLYESRNIDLFLTSLEVIKNNSYLISSINYSNNGIINNQYFNVSLDSINSVFRFRESFDDESFKNALKIAKDIYNKKDNNNKIILDIYHGCIVERH